MALHEILKNQEVGIRRRGCFHYCNSSLTTQMAGLEWIPAHRDPHLAGIVPDEWLNPKRIVFQNGQITISLHHAPCKAGHCVIFPRRKQCSKIQECEPDDMVAIGVALPLLKRALRLVTGFQCFLFMMRSGSMAGQAIDHMHMECIPTTEVAISFFHPSVCYLTKHV